MNTLRLIWHDRQTSLNATLDALREQPRHSVVSARLPLLADLTVADNIALPRCWHLGVSATLAREQARDFAARLLPIESADAYPGQLTRAQLFAALWLRAVAIPRQVIVVENPLHSFRISEAWLFECAERCHGLFEYALAHELRLQQQVAA